MPLGKLDTPLVRAWRAKLLAKGVSQTMAAKAYRLLRAILMTAVNEDRILSRNPCRIRGADREQAGERPVLSAAQVVALADAVPERYRAMILTATFASLRFGEVTALRRSDIDLTAGTVRVARAFGEVRGQGVVAGPPKSAAGARTVAIPRMVADELRTHMAEHVTGHALSAVIFTGPTGAPIRRGNFNKLVGWKDAVAKLGLPGLHFHDLRHTGNAFAAKSGVGTKDLMSRMGHDSMQAALIYQRTTDTGDARIKAALEAELAALDEDRADSDDDRDDGAAGVPAPV